MTEELLNALKLIKAECKKHESCSYGDCPMLDSCGHCGVQAESPDKWNLEKREVYF